MIWSPYYRRSAERSFTGTAGQQRVPTDFFDRFKIPLPPLPEQKPIAAILDTADALRRKRQQALQLTEQFPRSTFLDMFGDPVTNPNSWRQAAIGRIANVQGGLQVSANRTGSIELPYLRVANVFRDRLDLSEIKTMRVSAPERDRVLLHCNDVLVVEGHGNRDEIGRCAVWGGSIDPCIHQNHWIRVRVNRGLAFPDYVSAYINSLGGRRQLFLSSNTTSGLNTISTSTLKETLVLLPPLEEQQRFVSIRARRRVVEQRMHDSQARIDVLFHSLVQRAFRGEL